MPPRGEKQGVEIEYLNTDLDLHADHDLGPLVATLEARGLLVLHHDWIEPDRYRASFEVDCSQQDPESTVCSLLDIVESLDPASRARWDACSSRVFDMGFASGHVYPSLHRGLSLATLTRVVALRASVAVSIYPPPPKGL